jgi:iron complex transport system substrate-binding protein
LGIVPLITRALSLALPAVLVVGLSACQPNSYAGSQAAPVAAGERAPLADIAWLEDPRSWQGPSTALLSYAEITPIEESPSQTLPATVTSQELGDPLSVSIRSTDRVLALDMSGSLAATVWALGFGDRLIGRDISTNFPGVEELPVVTGSGHAISPESVLALRPDLIITDGTIGPLDVVLQLRDAGVTVVFVRQPPGLRAPAQMAQSVAAIFGSPTTGETLARSVNAEITAISDVIASRAPADPADKLRMVFLYLRGANGIYYLFGQESGAGDLIEALGGIDIATDIGWTGLRPMTDEALIAANPDLILVMSEGMTSVGGVEQLVKFKPAIGLTPAGQNLRFVDMADSQVLSFGPRTPGVIDALARAIYSPAK